MTTSERSLNLPNAITFSRFVLSLLLFALMQAGDFWLWAAGLFVFAVATDVLDGWIARKYKLITQLGRIMDPFVDKFITSGTFLFLLPVTKQSGVTPWMVVIVLGREMLVTSLRGFLEQRGGDFSASFSGKLKMFLQCVALTMALLSMDSHFATWTIGGVLVTDVTVGKPDATSSSMTDVPFTALRDVVLWTMVAVTVWSGWDYVQRAIQILRGLETKT